MKKVLIPAIIIVALAISYYFVIFMPSQQKIRLEQERKDFLFNKETECMDICKNIYEEGVASVPDGLGFNPEYAYNEQKNACFYSGGVFTSLGNMNKFVINCQTNEEVLSFMVVNDEVFTSFCDTCVGGGDEYERLKEEYLEK